MSGIVLTQSARAVECIDCISAEGQDSLNKYPGYDSKQSVGEAQVMPELWEIQTTPSLPCLWLRVVATDRVLSIGQIELFDI